MLKRHGRSCSNPYSGWPEVEARVSKRSILVSYLFAVEELGLREVLPFVRKWAGLAGGPRWEHAFIADRAVMTLLHFGSKDIFEYLPAILSSDARWGRHARFTATAELMGVYLKTEQADIEALGKAYANVEEPLKKLAVACSERDLVPNGVVCSSDRRGSKCRSPC